MKKRIKQIKKITLHHSLRLRILGLVTVVVISIICLMLFFILKQFNAISIYAIAHEGLLLSNILESGISNSAKTNNIREIQNYIDRLVEVRDKNDIEINVIFFYGEKSVIIASNNSGNIEETSAEEHKYLLKALESKAPIIVIDTEDSKIIEEEEKETISDSTHPDYFLLPGQRFLSVTTPLFDDNRKLGSINIKLSLAPLDKKIILMRKEITILIIFGIIILLLGISYILNSQVLNPLWQMAGDIMRIRSDNLDQHLPIANRKDEFSALGDEFNKMLIRINRLITEMQEMTNNIAHDLRSPITRIRGVAEITLTTTNSIDEYKNMTANTIEECDNLLTIINTMLYLVEVETGAIKIEKTAADMSKIIHNACELFRSIAEEKNISITIDVPEGLTVSGNNSMLQRVVANLLDNSLKYTPDSGQVKVTAQCKTKMMIISFIDNGIGISQEDIPHIFKRYYRCSQSRSNPGIGLGLSLCRAIVDYHNGNISVESSIGNGSTFIVSLPL